MKQVMVTVNGGPEVLRVVESAIPEPQAGQVRLKVLATGIAWADTMARRGQYPNEPKKPYALGYDVVGEVDKLGSNVTSVQPGQRVAAILIGFGGCAEYICVPEDLLVSVPDALSSAEAVAAILNGLTAYHALHDVAKIKAGESILITSAAGGVGTMAVQLAKLAGLKVYGATSSDKLALVRSLGATAIDYRNEDVVETLHRFNGGGVDVVLDMVGNGQQALSALKDQGRVMVVGGLSYKNSSLFALGVAIGMGVLRNLFMRNKKFLYLSDLPTKAHKNKSWYRNTLANLFELQVEGKLKAVVAKTYPLEQAAEGHRLLESGQAAGKIVLLPNAG